MKTISLPLTLSFMLTFFLLASTAQTAQTKTETKKSTTTTKSKTPVKKTSAPVVIKDVIVSLYNKNEGSISVFAGHKEDLKAPKLTIVGGLSTNKLYLKTNDVVCIMKNGKSVACASIKSSTVSLHINESGNGIAEK